MKERQITAYALNELQKKDRDNFESGLAGDEDLQSELQSVTRVADALEQIMSESPEGLEQQAREGLLRAMATNQKAFRARRKIVRFAVPISLAAAASIAVLLWVAGGMTPQGPAVAAADGAGIEEDPMAPQEAIVSRGLSGEFTAKLQSKRTTYTFSGTEESPGAANPVETGSQAVFRGVGIRTDYTAGRTISMSESGRAALELRTGAGLSLTSPAVRMKPLIWDEDLTRWGSSGGQP